MPEILLLGLEVIAHGTQWEPTQTKCNGSNGGELEQAMINLASPPTIDSHHKVATAKDSSIFIREAKTVSKFNEILWGLWCD